MTNEAEHLQHHVPFNSTSRVVLLPGLAADERMYARVREVLEKQCPRVASRLETPRLLVPESYEDISSYARRSAEALKIKEGDIVGGCSFGSMVASAIAAQIPVKGLILLSGALDSSTLVHSGHILNRIATFVPFMLLQRFLASDWFLRRVFGEADPADIELGRRMLFDTPETSMRRGGVLATNSRLESNIKVPVFALHGQEDKVIDPPRVDNCTIIPDAGHGMVVSHPRQVAEFISEAVRNVDRLYLTEQG